MTAPVMSLDRHAGLRRGLEALAASRRAGVWAVTATVTDVATGRVDWQIAELLVGMHLAARAGYDLTLTDAGLATCRSLGIDVDDSQAVTS